ncbi:uncharacterized protein [Mytilus edulis]|uniref:uncharacterized protein n=1 Tax=Mytilus edulis TaxID=6550 RepID=UPI0039EF0276
MSILAQLKLTTIEPTNDISTTQLTTGDTATPESQSTDLYVSVDSTSLQNANSTGNLQTNITIIQYNSEEATTKADRNLTKQTTIEPTNAISTTQLTTGDTATPESQSTDLHVSVDSTSLQKANSTANLQTNITTIQYNSEEATTKADRNQTKQTTIEPTNDISTAQLTTGDTATPESQSTDLHESVDSTSLQKANSTGNLQTNITTIQYNSEEATTKADSNQTKQTTIEPTNDISTAQLTTGDTATPESQSTDLHVSVDSTSLQKANSTGNLQTNITTIQYNSEEATTKADSNQTKLTTIEPTNDISTTQLTTGDTATPESQSTDLHVSVDSTSLQKANSTGNLQTNITTIQYNSEEATTKADRNQTNYGNQFCQQQ